MTLKKIIITMFCLSIAITAGCLSKESVSSSTTESVQGTPVPAIRAGIVDANSVATNTEPETGGKKTIIAASPDWQAKINADAQNNKAYAERIRFLTGQNKALIPIGVREATLSSPSISILLTDISVDKKNWIVSGYIENKGNTAITAASVSFTPVTSSYEGAGFVYIRILNNVNVQTTSFGDFQEIKPGQKLSFITHSMENEPNSDPEFLKRQETATLLAVEYTR